MRLVSIVARFLLVLAITVPIFAGSFIHEMVPHTHSGNPLIVLEMHSLLRVEHGDMALPILYIPLIASIAFCYFFAYRASLERTLAVAMSHSDRAAIRRGRERYRTFL